MSCVDHLQCIRGRGTYHYYPFGSMVTLASDQANLPNKFVIVGFIIPTFSILIFPFDWMVLWPNFIESGYYMCNIWLHLCFPVWRAYEFANTSWFSAEFLNHRTEIAFCPVLVVSFPGTSWDRKCWSPWKHDEEKNNKNKAMPLNFWDICKHLVYVKMWFLGRLLICTKLS